jgi:acetolactate synthase-1/2/3 large subunit
MMPAGVALRALLTPLPAPLFAPSPRTVSDRLADALVALRVQHAFGVFGGAIAPFAQSISRSSIELVHCRHEGGAAFAAIESSLASGRPAVVLATTGPGATNLLTGMVAARAEGAKVLFVTGCTPAAQRGRGAFQETAGSASALATLFDAGPLFHHTAVLEDPAELDAFFARLMTGFARPQGYVAHLGLPLSMQTAEREAPLRPRVTSLPPPVADPLGIAECVELLARDSFVIWAGFGARHASRAVRELAERAGAPVMCSPRGKGVMPEDHPLFLGVTGLGGHAEVETYLKTQRPSRVLVLGSRLSEMTSFWSPDFVPGGGIIHVDLDPDAFGAAYPNVPTLGVESEIAGFLDAVAAAWPKDLKPTVRSLPPPRKPEPLIPPREGAVRPSFLLQEVQRLIVERTDAPIITEAGNSFIHGTHYLRFEAPGRYRVSTSFGSMGQASAGVIGAAMAHGGKAFAILGDGAMLMNNEVNTAANYGVGAVWIVLNDARYGMVHEGMRSVGWEPFETDFPRVDFVSIANAMGGDGIRVEREEDVAAALEAGLCSLGPFVIDVLIDPTELAPNAKRNQSLQRQGLSTAAPAGPLVP